MEGRSPMSKRKQSSDEEIWSKRFDEDYEDLEYVSRSERNRDEKNRGHDGMSPMLTGTVIFLAVLILATILYYVWYSNLPVQDQASPPEPETENVAGVEDEEKEDQKPEPDTDEKPDSEPEDEPESDPEPETEPETEPESETEPETESNPDPEPETESDPEPETTPDPEPTGETYTVQPGDNMYRIALNHGLTTDELMSLNNLSDETVFVGQVLIVE